MKKVSIKTEYITLGQLLKLVGEIAQGSDAKGFLQSANITVNGENEARRGRKLRSGDEIHINSNVYVIE
jgi:ribosome-associated protein